MNSLIKHKIVVTGLGIISPLGNSLETHFNNLLEGVSGIKPILEMYGNGIFKTSIAGSVTTLSSSLPKNIMLAASAAKECIKNANLSIDECEEIDLCFGTAVASSLEMEHFFLGKHKEDPEIFRFNNTTEFLIKKFGLSGLSHTVTTGCVAGMDALGMALDLMRSDTNKKQILVTASDSTITPIVISSFDRIGALSKRNSIENAIRPFDENRDGFVIGEGAAAMLIETEWSAKQRGAKILAELVDWNSICSGYHMTSMRDSGEDLVRLIQQLLNKNDIKPEAIDHVDTHGTSTPINDRTEINALSKIFWERRNPLYISAQKSCTGHSLGASNLLELVGVVKMIENQVIPPIRGSRDFLELPDSFEYVIKPKNVAITNVLKISSGFSGIHSAFLLRKY